jgi:hypothetical protein
LDTEGLTFGHGFGIVKTTDIESIDAIISLHGQESYHEIHTGTAFGHRPSNI